MLLALIFAAFGCAVTPRTDPPVTCKATTDCSSACATEKLEACVAACAAKLSPAARPYWDALQTCSKANCKEKCESPTAISCKLCVMGNCASQAAACLSH